MPLNARYIGILRASQHRAEIRRHLRHRRPDHLDRRRPPLALPRRAAAHLARRRHRDCRHLPRGPSPARRRPL